MTKEENLKLYKLMSKKYIELEENKERLKWCGYSSDTRIERYKLELRKLLMEINRRGVV